VENAKRAAEVLSQTDSKPKKGTKGGRPAESDSTRSVAEGFGPLRAKTSAAFFAFSTSRLLLAKVRARVRPLLIRFLRIMRQNLLRLVRANRRFG
jgi:hypothetical protein